MSFEPKITIEAAENGFVITCRSEVEDNGSVLNGMSPCMGFDEDVYVADCIEEVLTIVEHQIKKIIAGEVEEEESESDEEGDEPDTMKFRDVNSKVLKEAEDTEEKD